MEFPDLHRWDLPPKDAIQLQKALARQVISDRPVDFSKITLVAGVDVSVKSGWSQAAVIVTRMPDMEVIETSLARRETSYPYIPGLLSFREGPVLVEAFRKLSVTPDLLLFDGIGIAHPRRIGIASHMGLWLNLPTVGCGKSRLCGEHDIPSPDKGGFVPLTHRGETIGAVLTTRPGVAPMIISPGHLCDLPSAITATMVCLTRFRLPEPVRFAHKAAAIV